MSKSSALLRVERKHGTVRLLNVALVVGSWVSCSEVPAPSDPSPCGDSAAPRRFRATFGGTGKDNGQAVAMMSDNSLVIGGTVQKDGKVRGWVRGLTPTGETRFEQQLDAPDARVIAAVTGGTLVLSTGFSGRRLSVDGAVTWQQSWAETTDPELELPQGVIEVADGFVVAGTRLAAKGDNTSRKARILGLSADGTVRFNLLEGSDGKNTAAAIASLPDGDFVTVGFSEAPISDVGRQLWVRAAEKDGTKTWEQRHGGALDEAGVGVLALANKELLIAASTRSKGAGENDLWLVKTTAHGHIQWDKTFGGEANDDPLAIAALDGGGALIAGRYTSELTHAGGFWLLRVGPGGDKQWEHVYGTAWQSEAVAVAARGEEFAAVGTTSTHGAGSDDVWLLRGGPDGKAWCAGNVGAPCKGPAAETCITGLVCDVSKVPAECARP